MINYKEKEMASLEDNKIKHEKQDMSYMQGRVL